MDCSEFSYLTNNPDDCIRRSKCWKVDNITEFTKLLSVVRIPLSGYPNHCSSSIKQGHSQVTDVTTLKQICFDLYTLLKFLKLPNIQLKTET